MTTVLLLAALALHASAEPFASFPDGSTVEIDDQAKSLVFNEPRGAPKKRVRLRADRLDSFGTDEGFLYVTYYRGRDIRIAVYHSDGRRILDTAGSKSGGYVFATSPERIVLTRPHETFVFDANGRLLCHENDPEDIGPLCDSASFVSSHFKGTQ